MLDEFLDTRLAQIDDLSELKVTLVALRLLERKQSDVPFITTKELEAHPALREGLGALLHLRLETALRSAVARGTLLVAATSPNAAPRYFANTPAARALIENLESAMAGAHDQKRDEQGEFSSARDAITREMARLESVEIYPAAPGDDALIGEWLGRGYAPDEILEGLRAALRLPRAGGSPRSLASCAKAVEKLAPHTPSAYYRVVIARTERPGDAIVNLRERLRRAPTAQEFNAVMAAVGVFGAQAVLRGLKMVSQNGAVNVDALMPLLAESEEAALELARKETQTQDVILQDMLALYEDSLGLPPTGLVADEIRDLLNDQKDPQVWRGAFAYAIGQGKKSWAYVRKIIRNPSPNLFVPEPASETARFAFDEYKRRVGRLDPAIANDINQIAARVGEQARWTQAMDKAAAANALNWNYIKAVLVNELNAKQVKQDGTHGKPKANSTGARKRVTRRPQVQYSDADREAARERARKQIEEREKQKSSVK